MARDRVQAVREIDFWRQADIVVPGELPPVTVIGAGGIGSFTLLALAKMGVQYLVAIDDDKVEEHNIPNQLYALESVGNLKVDAAVRLCKELAGVKVMPCMKKFGATDQLTRGIVVSGVDSMASRKAVWERVKGNLLVPLYVEARMGAEVSRIYSICPNDSEQQKFYEGTLYDDKDALEEPCTARAIIYNGFAIAALIANQVKKFAKKEELFKEIIFDMKTLTLLTA